MTQFRKKPLLVDAVPVDDILESNPVPEWVTEAMTPVDETDEGYGAIARVRLVPDGIDIITKQSQVVHAGSGEWLLRAAPDDLWPIDGDVFEASYERPDLWQDPPDGWQGTEPAEGTRRALIRDTIATFPVGEGSLVDNAPALADSIEIALQSSAEQPSLPPAETIGSDLEMDTLLERMRSASDYQRGELLAIIGAGGTSRVGTVVRVAAEQIEGLAPVSARAAFMLAALGILDQAGD